MRDIFAPGHCRAIPSLTDRANRLYETWCRSAFQPLKPMRYARDHFFWVLNAKTGDKQVIVDPTGVPTAWEGSSYKLGSVQPYFGLIEKAPATHQRIYRAMQEMDDWGTRDLPPGFHP